MAEMDYSKSSPFSHREGEYLLGTSSIQDRVTVGEFVPNRNSIGASTVSHVSGTMGLAFFTADKTETINTITAYTGPTAAAATPTLCRFGVYEIDPSDNGTLIASTPNDTTLFSAIHTAYAKGLSAPFNKVAGNRYAIGLLVVSGVAVPNFVGQLFPGVSTYNIISLIKPANAGRLASLTDIPESFLGTSLVGYQQKVATRLS